MIKFLNVVLVLVISILLAMSAFALIEIHWSLTIMKFSFSPSGIETYLTSLGKYKYLFTGTISTCSVYFGSLRVKATFDSNKEKIKQDRFNEWKTILQIRFSEISKSDPMMIREINKIRLHIFNSLFDLDFKIADKEQLKTLFNKHFKDFVTFFETQNNKSIKLGGAYPNDKYSYSFGSFYSIFSGMLDSWYDNIHKDLKDLYHNNLPNDRTINENTFNAANKAANSSICSWDDL